MNLTQEFDRQVATLVCKGYPELLQKTDSEFTDELYQLKALLPTDLTIPVDFDMGTLPFVIVVQSGEILAEQMMARTELQGKPGITKLFPHQSTDFTTIAEVNVPSAPYYLLVDIDRGTNSINLPPSQAMELITTANRSPLTIDEGIALITHYPEFLRKNHCFSLLASRHQGDQRVPAIWINSQKQPNLGWCWNGNPHTWLGSASAGARMSAH